MAKILYEKESYHIVRACLEVHNHLGCGFLETVYEEALALEFRTLKIPFERQKVLKIFYKGNEIKKHYSAHFVCYDKVLLELKAVTRLNSDHDSQVLNYLKAADLKLGMILNFGESSFRFKRLIK